MSVIAFLVGFASWSPIEYLLHRFVFHERVLGKRAAAEHLEHHARVDWFAPWSSKLTLAALILGALSAVAWPVLGLGPGVSLVAGTVSAWLAYEALHRAIHVFPPRGAYARWAWRHHLHHHFADPRGNHGVSSPLWDRLLGTFEPVEVVVVPPKQAHKLPWLLGPDGAVRPELADTYRLGRGRAPAPEPPEVAVTAPRP